MSRYEVRKNEIKQRIDALEKRRDELYGKTGKIEDELIDMNEKAIEKRENLVDLKKKGDVLDSYMQFLENQLVIVGLEPYAYSIENFDMSEKGRLMVILRRGDETKFNWYVKKKQEGYEFGQFEPLHEILKEDYENFCRQQEGE